MQNCNRVALNEWSIALSDCTHTFYTSMKSFKYRYLLPFFLWWNANSSNLLWVIFPFSRKDFLSINHCHFIHFFLCTWIPNVKTLRLKCNFNTWLGGVSDLGYCTTNKLWYLLKAWVLLNGKYFGMKSHFFRNVSSKLRSKKL